MPSDAKPFVSACCEGERCTCGAAAEHKVEETIFDDDPGAYVEMEFCGEKQRYPARHPLTSYICHPCFVRIMGPAAECGR